MTESSEINAITLRVTDMATSLAFYEALGLDLAVAYGGAESAFSSLKLGANFINLTAVEGAPQGSWGRVIFHVPDPDAVWTAVRSAGHTTETDPADAPWGERYFHVCDPDGHELSFARRL